MKNIIKAWLGFIGDFFSAIIVLGYFLIVAFVGACIGTMLLIVITLKKRRRLK